MIDAVELDRIIAFAVPIEHKDCKRVVAKKEWRREELKKMINDMIDKEAALKLTAMVIASSVQAHKEKAKPVPDFPTGGVLNAPFVAITGNDDGPEYIRSTDIIDRAIKQMEIMRPTEAPDIYLPKSDLFETVEQFEALRKSRQKDDPTAEESKI